MSITALAKQKFGKPLAASALALSMAFAPMAANDAQAADRSSANVSTSAPFQYSIVKKDFTKLNVDVARVGAARVSAQNNGMMIVYSGDDILLQNKVRKAGSLARNEQLPVIGMAVIGKSREIGENQFIIVANGSATFPRDPASLSDSDLVDFIAEVNREVLQPSLKAERERTQTIAALD